MCVCVCVCVYVLSFCAILNPSTCCLFILALGAYPWGLHKQGLSCGEHMPQVGPYLLVEALTSRYGACDTRKLLGRPEDLATVPSL